MQIHYFAAARAAAGVAEEQIDQPGPGTTLAQILNDRASAHDGTTDSGMTLADIFPRCSFLVDGANTTPDTVVSEARRIDVLPPFAGG